MLARLRRCRPSHATIVAYLALFISVGGGTAFAVVAANQVNSSSIIDGQVKNPDLGPNSVGPGKVINNSLTGADLSGVGATDLLPNSVNGSKVADNALTGVDVQENTLQGVDAATLGGQPPTDF